jgi:AraC family transcriptional regulator
MLPKNNVVTEHFNIRVVLDCSAKQEVIVGGLSYLEIEPPFDVVEITIPKALLSDFPSMSQVALKVLDERQVLTAADSVVSGLIRCFLPAADHGGQHNQTFFFHVVSALLLHLGPQFQGHSLTHAAVPLGLRPWQEMKAKKLLLSSSQGEMPLSKLSVACGLSESHFARAFKKTTGMSTRQWLQEQRIAVAKNLLAEAEQEIAQIALDLGYSDQSHFTRVFSKMVGVSPGAWRRNERADRRIADAVKNISEQTERC